LPPADATLRLQAPTKNDLLIWRSGLPG